tara:strand:+ start:136 stop:339 length:204 start_codon:yes stop_codon:yes gene_type:complete
MLLPFQFCAEISSLLPTAPLFSFAIANDDKEREIHSLNEETLITHTHTNKNKKKNVYKERIQFNIQK